MSLNGVSFSVKAPVRLLFYLFQFTWGLLQNIAGLAVFLYLLVRYPGSRVFMYGPAVCIRWNRSFSAGIGIFIFIGDYPEEYSGKVLVHEFGHTVQSAFLGPLFILFIWIPSAVWAFFPVFVRYRRKRNVSYYRFYPEKWANHLGIRITGHDAPV